MRKKALNYVATMLLCELLLLLLCCCCCCCLFVVAAVRCVATSGNACACIALIAATNICTTPVILLPLPFLCLSLSLHAPLYLSRCCSSPCLPCCSCSVHIPCKPLCILPSFYLVCSLSPCLSFLPLFTLSLSIFLCC